MSNSTITALTAATTPLAGTEILPVVQGGVTTKVPVADLTAGRVVSAAGLAIDANSATDAVRITQIGTGNAFVVEDSASPDANPFTIDSSGIVLIGLTTLVGGEKVQAVGGYGAYRYTNDTSASFINIRKSRGVNAGDVTTVQSGDQIGNLNFLGTDGTAFVSAAAITTEVDGTPATGSMPGRLVFRTTPTGSGTPVEAMRITSGQGVQIARTAVTAPAASDGNIYSGTYTPTLTNNANVTASTAAVCQYMRVGAVVTVSGTISGIAVTAAAVSTIDISLPIASNLSSLAQCAGSGAFYSATLRAIGSGAIYGVSATDVARFDFLPSVAATSQAIAFSFTYRVI